MIFGGRTREFWWILFLVLLAQGAAVLWFSIDDWYGWLPAAVYDYETTSLFAAPVVAASAAFMAGAGRAHGATDWLASGPRSRETLERPVFVWATAAAALATSLLAGALLIVNWQHATPLAVIRLVVTWLSLVSVAACAVGFGVLISRWLSPWVAPLCALLAPYLFVAVLSAYLEDSPLSGIPIPNFQGGPYVWSSWTAFASRAAVAIFCAIAFAAFFTQRRRVLSGAWILTAIAVGAVIFTAGTTRPVLDAQVFTCQGQDPVACFDRTQSARSDYFIEQITQSKKNVPSSLFPGKVYLNYPTSPPDGLVVIPKSGKYMPARWMSGRSIEPQFGDALFATECRSLAQQDTSIALRIWWRLRIGAPLTAGDFAGQLDLTRKELAPQRALAQRWRDLSEKVEMDTIERQGKSLRQCQLRD